MIDEYSIAVETMSERGVIAWKCGRGMHEENTEFNPVKMVTHYRGDGSIAELKLKICKHCQGVFVDL